jgi:hypothetical protein
VLGSCETCCLKRSAAERCLVTKTTCAHDASRSSPNPSPSAAAMAMVEPATGMDEVERDGAEADGQAPSSSVGSAGVV